MSSKIKLSIFFILLIQSSVSACEMCQSQQPKALQNITHGTGPESNWDFVIIITAAIIVAVTLFLSIKFLIRPGEKSPKHIKNIVVEPNQSL